jgi:hypothetical protein
LGTTIFLSVGLWLKVHSRVLAATIDFQFEIQTIAFIERCHASTFNGADMNKRIGLTVIALNEAEAFHSVEELDRAARTFAGKLTLRSAITCRGATAETAGAWFTCFTRRAAIGHRKGFAIDLQIGRRNLAAAIDQGEAQRLTFGQTCQAGLLDCADVNEHIFATIVTHDKAEALLSIEELYNAGAFANDLGRHAATAAASTRATAAETAAAASTAAEAAATAEAITAAATAETVAATKAAAATAEAITAAAKTAATLFCVSAEILVAETVPLVLAAPAATSIKTHALLVTFASPIELRMNMPDEGTCRIRRKTTVWNQYRQIF